MTEQPIFADLEYQHKKRQTRRDVFLKRIDSLIPWQRLEERIRPHYFKAERGRRPYPLSVMLRVHVVQLCYNVSDPGMEDLLYEAESVRRFAGLRLSEPIPDESTILHFRHMLEERHLGQGLFAEINEHLASQGLRLRERTIVDATIIEAPSSTKNRTGQRDPEMRQVKKGNQYHFGIVGKQQIWDTVRADRSGVGWRSGELADGPVGVSSPLDCLRLHLPLTCKTNSSTGAKNWARPREYPANGVDGQILPSLV